MQFDAFYGYMILFLIGFVYAIVSAVLSGALGGDFGANHDVGGGAHVDIGTHLDSGMVHFAPLSPTVIATFLTAFGGMGMICMKVFAMGWLGALPVSLVVALAIAAGIFALFEWIFEKVQGSSNVNAAQLVGTRADVITPIPEKGVGEIALVASGLRQNAPARSHDGRAIESPCEVEIVRAIGGSYVVRRVVQLSGSARPGASTM
jgi:membrane protein implicated in regulation of membrane protease activity